MRIIDADAFEKYAWSNPDIEVDGEPYISPSAVQNFAMDHPITVDLPNEWVSVEERWPEPGRRVLASCGYFVGEAWISVGGEWYRHDGFAWDNLGSDVTHWTNLPAPPERRNSNESEEET